ncbi:hypothetical protein [Subtercola endophyticus]|uniref:hypothetical protein n=1 Tax=Subtercola endophyticus TaxID=2895559 RepID=UPI001E3A5A28|nr:hypothetical protein [Subtercola endophyticus]UFS58452.1 hypothetical protein LQ955_15815 [Subtercola endophyticus]
MTDIGSADYGAQRFSQDSGEGASASHFRFGAELVQSRKLLLEVLTAFEGQKEALTVIGAHAVFERVKHMTGDLAMDSTRDADVAVLPQLVTAVPQVGEVMASLGLELASPSRPGVWGRSSDSRGDLHGRLTIDLIAPAALAGNGRRAARIEGEHGKNSVSKTAGVELVLVDRSLLTLESFDTSGASAEVYVAGVAALLCAKAYKLHDRLNARELVRKPDRLRPKDAGDMWRLMKVSAGAAVRATFDEAAADPRIGEAVALGAQHLNELATNRAWLPQLAVLHLRDTYNEKAVRGVIDEWIGAFGRAEQTSQAAGRPSGTIG